MRKVLKIDELGFYIEDVILQDEEETPVDCTEVQPPEGLYKLRFVDGVWVEGSTLSELQTIEQEIHEYIAEIQAKIDAEIEKENKFQAIVVATEELVQQVVTATPETIANKLTLKERAEIALQQNRDFIALTSPTNVQTLAQVKSLTKQNIGIIRLLLNKLDGID